ncbi:MAG: SDR family NAD(P)-dependent oxidoreductase [Alphaproteobacteria bacterium]
MRRLAGRGGMERTIPSSAASNGGAREIFDVAGARVLVTGASVGLGRHFAATLARAGAHVVAAARRVDMLERLATDLRDSPGRIVPLILDVTSGESIRAAVQAAEDRLGGLDVLVNNAGIAVVKPLFEWTEADWDRVVDTNLRGAWLVAQEAARRMVARGSGGAIINIASVLGIRPIGQVPAYTAAKAGLIQLTRTMAMELARHDIRVNAIAPGYVETEMNRDFWGTPPGKALIARIPQRRVGRPEELDGVLLLLASGASRYMTGSVVVVDGGHLCSSM